MNKKERILMGGAGRLRRSGFTLIELLIVVAIIAILAAIAVPNFLEAQVRAKVSRAKADMRTVATAIESYAVDSGNYPYGMIDFVKPSGSANWGFLPESLTTPVSYLSTLPVDQFNIDYINGSNNSNSYTRMGHPHARYRLATRKPWPYAPGPYTPAPDGWVAGYVSLCKLLKITDTIPYIVVSPGPDFREDNLPWYHPAIYDPSNGTVSQGDITFLGGGGIR